MRTDLFDFELPAASIALRPASPRDSARLLVVQPDAVLRDQLDMAIVSRFGAPAPRPRPGLREWDLGHDALRLCVPAGHRLAGKDSIMVADLAAEHLLQDPDAVPEWRDIAVELRDGQPPGRIPFFRTVEEKLEHVAAGHGIAVLPLSTATFYTRADISHVLVCDIAPNQVCLAWDSLRRSPLIRDYAAIARTVCSAATAPPLA